MNYLFDSTQKKRKKKTKKQYTYTYKIENSVERTQREENCIFVILFVGWLPLCLGRARRAIQNCNPRQSIDYAFAPKQ